MRQFHNQEISTDLQPDQSNPELLIKNQEQQQKNTVEFKTITL